MSDAKLAIQLLGESKWYQSGDMHAESLMNVLERLSSARVKPTAYLRVANDGRISYTSNPPRRSQFGDTVTPLYRAQTQVEVTNVDELAQEIRRVDGSHTMGAGLLAEAIVAFLERHAAQQRGGCDE